MRSYLPVLGLVVALLSGWTSVAEAKRYRIYGTGWCACKITDCNDLNPEIVERIESARDVRTLISVLRRYAFRTSPYDLTKLMEQIASVALRNRFRDRGKLFLEMQRIVVKRNDVFWMDLKPLFRSIIRGLATPGRFEDPELEFRVLLTPWYREPLFAKWYPQYYEAELRDDYLDLRRQIFSVAEEYKAPVDQYKVVLAVLSGRPYSGNQFLTVCMDAVKLMDAHWGTAGISLEGELQGVLAALLSNMVRLSERYTLEPESLSRLHDKMRAYGKSRNVSEIVELYLVKRWGRPTIDSTKTKSKSERTAGELTPITADPLYDRDFDY